MYLKTTRYKKFDSIELKESLFKEFILPDHFHDTYCIGLLCQGLKKTIVEGNHSIVHSNCVTIVNPYQVHSDQNFDQDASRFKMIYINKDAVNYIARKIDGLHAQDISFTNELISNPFILQAVMEFFRNMSEECFLEQKLFTLIELLLANYIDQNVTERKFTAFQNALMDSIDYARLHFNDKIDISKMATTCHLSKFQFIRYFKKMTGLTPANYIIVCRINHAKSLLVKGYPIGQLALEAGFYDHSQYCKFFKYFMGLSPIEYQRSCNIIQTGITN